MLGRALLVVIATVAWCPHAMAGDLNNFIADGESQGFSTYWNTISTAGGGWKYIGGWMDSSATVVEEQEFFSDGTLDDEAGGSPSGGPQPFHDWASGHGFSIGSGNWGPSGRPCGIFHVCDSRDVY